MGILNNNNYFSRKNNMLYTGSSQIKSAIACESKMIAELKGKWKEEKSEALLTSSYLDEAISGTLEKFKKNNPEIFTKQGELKSQYKHIEEIYNEINKKRNAKFKKYLSGEHQVIMTGKISEVPIKIKIDSYFPRKMYNRPKDS